MCRAVDKSEGSVPSWLLRSHVAKGGSNGHHTGRRGAERSLHRVMLHSLQVCSLLLSPALDTEGEQKAGDVCM